MLVLCNNNNTLFVLRTVNQIELMARQYSLDGRRWSRVVNSTQCPILIPEWLTVLSSLLPLYCFRTAFELHSDCRRVVVGLLLCAFLFLSCYLLPLVPLVMPSVALRCLGCFSLWFIRFSCALADYLEWW